MSDERTENPESETVQDGIPPAHEDEVDEAAELVKLAVDDGKGGKAVPLSALIATKKEAKAMSRRVKELEAGAAETASLKERLAAAEPYVNALVSDPRLRAEALRIVRGGQPAQVTAQEDTEAQEYAELHGLYLSDGTTPDATKARKMIDWHDRRNRSQQEEAMRPLAGLALGQKAEANIREAMSMTDADGVPLATPESIREVAAQLPAHLLADQRVVDLVLNNAIGIDRRNRRTPKAPEEPLYLDTPHGRRRSEPSVDASTKGMLERLGLTEKDYHESGQALDALTRRGR